MTIRMRKLILALLVIALMSNTNALASVDVRANADTRAYVTASTASGSVKVTRGTELSLLAYSGDWAKVSYRGVSGYMLLRDLNLTTRISAYAKRDTHVYSSATTSSTAYAIKLNTKLYVIGRSGDFYRVQNASGTVTAYIAASDLTRTPVNVVAQSGSASLSSWKKKVVKLDWFKGGSNVLGVGDYGYIYDIRTGITICVKRMGGVNHADVEPATASDAALLKQISGGSYSWDSRSVILYSDGYYVACAINTMPHGSQTISDNNYSGQFCLHMVNSRTHGTDSVNTSHQTAIALAYLWATN